MESLIWTAQLYRVGTPSVLMLDWTPCWLARVDYKPMMPKNLS